MSWKSFLIGVVLQQVTEKKFDNKVEWGIDLASEHERLVNETIVLQHFILWCGS